MDSEFITRITYNFPLEMFMVVGMVRRKDTIKGDVPWKILLVLIRPSDTTGRRLLRIGFPYVHAAAKQ